MSNVIDFNQYKTAIVQNTMDTVEITPGIPIPRPQTKQEYLDICKEYLFAYEYEKVLCAIMDESYFDKLDPTFQKITSNYFTFPY